MSKGNSSSASATYKAIAKNAQKIKMQKISNDRYIENKIVNDAVKKIESTTNNNVYSSSSSVSPGNSSEQFIRQMSNENTAATFKFNAEEAQKARDFQEYMSNTSHQREVEDLKRAGLNPVLSANGGAQAYSASSASGSADSSAVGAMASLYSQRLSNANAVKIAEMNNKNEMNIAKASLKNNKEIAKINAQASKYASDNSYTASKYASDVNKWSTKYSGDVSKWNTKYSSDSSSYASRYATDRSKYGMIDNFINSLIGDNSKNTNSASKAAGSWLKNKFKKLIKK